MSRSCVLTEQDPGFRQSLINRGINLPDSRQFQLAFLAKELIRSGEQRYRGNRSFGFEDLVHCWRLASEVEDPLVGIDDERLTEEDVFAALLRLGWQQFSWRDPLWVLIPRADVLFNPGHDFKGTTPFDCGAAFHAKYGLSLDSFRFLGFALLLGIRLARDGRARPDFLTRRADVPECHPEHVARFLSVVAADVSDFLGKLQEHPGLAGLEPYEFNPLHASPVIEFANGNLVCPIPRLLVERFTMGVYYDLIGTDERFPIYFGEAFEAYVGSLLREQLGESQVVPVPPAGRLGRRRCDWAVISGDNVVLIECKTPRPSLLTRVTGDPKALASDPKRTVVHGLSQLADTLVDIKAGVLRLPGVDASANLYPLLVSLEDIPLSNAPPIRVKLDAALTREGLARFQYQMADVAEFELLVAQAPGQVDIAELVARKFREPTYCEMPLKNYLLQQPEVDTTARCKLLEHKYEEVRTLLRARLAD